MIDSLKKLLLQTTNPEYAAALGWAIGVLESMKPKAKRPKTVREVFKSKEELPESLNTVDFLINWAAWIAHRCEIRKPLTPTAARQQIAKLEAMGERRAVAALKHSTANGWQGIFEPTTNGKAGNKPTLVQEIIDNGNEFIRLTGGVPE